MNEKQEQIQGEIIALKSLLADTDYQCLKYAEGALTEAEFADTKAKRRAWREEINELEDELDSLTAGQTKAME
jgi:hypothetical protein